MPPDPTASGRSAVVAPGGGAPPGWDGCPRVVVDAVDAAVADTLGAAWRERRSVVVELHPGLGLDDPSTPPGDVVTGLQPWEWSVDLDLLGDRLHHAVWANAVDARDAAAPPRFRWADAAIESGAGAGGPLDAVLPDGQPALCDGGPLDLSLGERLGVAVLHRVAVEHGSIRPIAPATTAAELAPDQLAAVTHPGGGARVIAPAGSGKTRVLTERARTLLTGCAIPPPAVALVAFNVRAAGELRERLADVAGIRIRTLNALGLRLLPDGVRTIDEPRVRDHLSALVNLPRRAEADPAAPWLEALARARLGMRDPRALEVELPDVTGLDEIARGYRARLRANDEADFDEQVVGAIERLLADPAFRHRAQRFARVLLVDEFQDLTPAHLLLIRLLSGPAGAVFGVGDDDQTIYGYAGATPEWLVRFPEIFPGSAVHALEVNYRCPPAVVTAAANLLTRNALRVPKQIRSAPDAADEPGALQILPSGEGPASRSAGRVIELVGSGAAPAEIAVLARVNAVLAPVQVLLRHQGIPVRGGVDTRFLQRGGVRAALAWLDVASAPERRLPSDRLTDAARRPKRGMSRGLYTLLGKQHSVADLHNLAAWLSGKESTREADKIVDLAVDVGKVRAAADGGTTADVIAVIRHEIGTGGLDASAGALDGWSHGAIAAHGDDLDTLAALADLEPDPSRFGAWLAEALAAPDDPDGVTLASIHAVKGREWPHVVLHHVSDGLLPHRLVDDEEEERRVLHVGLTRGRRTVTVVAGVAASPFLSELAAAGSPSARRVAPAPTARRPVADKAEPSPLSPEAEPAFERLRAWRTAKAKDIGKPAYVVFADDTLRLLATAMPADEAGLRRVKGVGPAKLEAYGDELLVLLDELRAG